MCKALEREAATLASISARSLAQKLSAQFAPKAIAAGAESNARSGLNGGVNGPGSADDQYEMMRRGFERLGPVVALSVLTDEPGLIADDIRWLTRMFGARHISMGGDDWAIVLLRTYSEAGVSILPETASAAVHDVIERAILLLTHQGQD